MEWYRFAVNIGAGQLAIEKDTKKGKWGDGITAYSVLDYVFYEGVIGGQVEVPVTTNPFTYASGITSYKPPIEVCLKVGTVYTPYGVATWDKSNGDITTDVYNGSDTFVLIVG